MRENLRSYQGPVGPHRRDLVVIVGVKAGVNVETRNIMDLSPCLPHVFHVFSHVFPCPSVRLQMSRV